MKNLFPFLLLFVMLFGCGPKNSANSSNESETTNEDPTVSQDPCDDMLSYNRGASTGRANKNLYADCDYFWELDNDGNMSQYCYCEGYNSIEKEL